MDRLLNMDMLPDMETLLALLAEKKDNAVKFAGETWEQLRNRDVAVLKPMVHLAQKAEKRVKDAKKLRAGLMKAKAVKAKAKAVGEKIPTPADVKNAALRLWGKTAAAFAALWAAFLHPGLSEIAAIGAFLLSAVGMIGSFFNEKLRRLRPLFAALAAIGTIIVILRLIFPRRDD